MASTEMGSRSNHEYMHEYKVTNQDIAASRRAAEDGFRALVAMHGADIVPRIKNARLLVVGAGGVGCELLKDLIHTGFTQIEVVDMDGIDVSNLNRQFLFRRRHVGKPKSTVAAEQVQRMRPGVTTSVNGIVSNVKDPRFDVAYFRSFTVVCNALDNVDARRHVNRMCVAANVPMVESGSTGYNGQVDIVIPGVTECYDCQPKSVPKTFAVCTIRSTPEKPEHCIVWAKYLYNLLFGPKDESNLLTDIQGLEDEVGLESPEAYARRVGESVFQRDIKTQISMKDLWEKRKPPTPIDLVKEAADELPVTFSRSGNSGSHRVEITGQEIWSVSYSSRVFLDVVAWVKHSRAENVGALTFDKDDVLAMAFVTAASNLRAAAFGVEMLSPFKAKGIAGNIVHAIATTNAMVAGLVGLQVVHLLANFGNDFRSTVVCKDPRGRVGRQSIIMSSKSSPPNPNCGTCSRGFAELRIALAEFTLGQFVDQVARGALKAQTFSLLLNGDLIFDSDDDVDEEERQLYDSNLARNLLSLGFSSGCILEIHDVAQNMACSVYVTNVDADSAGQLANGFSLTGCLKVMFNPADREVGPVGGSAKASDELDLEISNLSGPAVGKRTLIAGEEEESGRASKKARVILDDTSNIIELD